MPFDDSDMKIAGDDFEPVKKADEQESVEATARQLAGEKQRQSQPCAAVGRHFGGRGFRH